MTLELIVFIAAILFGILLYWRESNGNGFYRFVNKIVNSKELQMKPDDKTGFVYKQTFLLRLVFVAALFLVLSVVLSIVIPFSYTSVSIYLSCIVGTLVGTYVANFVIKSGKVIEEKGDTLEDMVSETIEKGKEYIDDIRSSSEESTEEVIETPKKTEPKDGKSARERLKDKGYL